MFKAINFMTKTNKPTNQQTKHCSHKKHDCEQSFYVFNSQRVCVADFNESLPLRMLLMYGFARNGIDQITPNYDFKHIAAIISMFINQIHHFTIKYAFWGDEFPKPSCPAMNVILFKEPMSCYTRWKRYFTFRNNPCIQESQCSTLRKESYSFEIWALGIKKNSRLSKNIRNIINHVSKDQSCDR